jgi:DNA-binding transcriptional MerR regulator
LLADPVSYFQLPESANDQAKSQIELSNMSHPAVAIPEKLFFIIGEVCELAGVQAHVLRYWESEFPTLAPQKNRAGQRVYRKRDVEMALRIKELLYDDQYTIAGAKKRLANEVRTGAKLRVVSADDDAGKTQPLLQEAAPSPAAAALLAGTASGGATSVEERLALRRIAAELRELLELLEAEANVSGSRSK